MKREELLNRRRVADPTLTSQTQTREGNHARVSLERKDRHVTSAALPERQNGRACGGTLFLRLGGELQRIALATAGFRSARGLGLGDVAGVDGDDAHAAPM